MRRASAFVLRIVLSVLAILAATMHMLFPRFIPDAITAGLIMLAVLPWLHPIIKSIEVTGLGKLELKVEEVKQSQALLQEQVDGLRFLVGGFVTQWELNHLTKLATGGPFQYSRGSGKDDRFINEIIRMRDFGLISKRIEYALHDIPLKGDLKDYVDLTERGRTYLMLRQQLGS